MAVAPAPQPRVPLVSAARLSDDSVSIKVCDREVFILPDRLHCTLDHLQRMLAAVESALVKEIYTLRDSEIEHLNRRVQELEEENDNLEDEIGDEEGAKEILEDLTW